MANIFNVAKYILGKTGSVSIWKLQKLCYYAEAWSLVWTDEPLFSESFEAWSNGPVCRELADSLQGKFVINETDIENGNSENLSDDQKDTVNRVITEYGKMELFELRGLVRSEKSWIDARGGIPDGAECHTIISKGAIKAYHESL